MMSYEAGLPTKRMAVGVLFRDENVRLLIVQPTYREAWLVPGGSVEHNESPLRAAQREVAEELGLILPISRLLCVDYRPADAQKSECVHCIFDGGTLDAAQRRAITLPPAELQSYAFLALADALPQLDVHLARRIALAWAALPQGITVYAEDGVITDGR
jgi:8-oxo-dGTP pyrophosphatase MutT (NUDIX family)